MRKTWVIPSLVAVLALSACAPVAEPAETAAPLTSVTPTAEPEPVGPERVFDGDCAGLATVDAVGADVGARMTLQDLPWRFEAGYVAIAQFGGIHCVWSSGPPGDVDTAYVSVVVLPTRSVAEAVEHALSCESNYCNFDTSVSGFELFGSASGPNDPSATATMLTARFSQALAAQPVPDAYSPADAWAPQVDCASLDPAGSIGTVLGDPAIVGYPYGGDAEANRGFYVASRASALSECTWISETDRTAPSAEVDILPGGAWIYDEIAATSGATAVTVPGLDRGLLVEDTFYGFSGSNRIGVTLDPRGSAVTIDQLYPALAEIAADLSSRG
jgi:hypothetical protein